MIDQQRNAAARTEASTTGAPNDRRAVRPALLALAATLAALQGGCAASGEYVRVEDLPAAAGLLAAGPEEESRLAPGDVVSVRVWNQEAMSVARTRVRDDGRISVPFLQDVEVASRTPTELSTMLKAKLMAFVVNPVVTVSVDEVRPLRVPVTGEVVRPGVYELERRAGVLAALAAAGGFSDFARRDAVYVLRYQLPVGEPAPLRIRFSYRALTQGARPAAAFRLRDGDVVVVD